jgi:signal transduction histidine kinase
MSNYGHNKGDIFKPFFTTKGIGKGIGLGLSISYRIAVKVYKGDIGFSSKPGDNCFQVRIPIHFQHYQNLDSHKTML